jgi:putative methionine-R-sulfoxide reductase with GAF domain
MVLPVNIWGTDASGQAFHQLAYTLDISTGGARLADVRVALKRGDVVAVRYKQNKARFRVAWVANNQAGIEYLAGEKFIWIELPEEGWFVDRDPASRSGERPAAAEPEVVSAEASEAEIEIAPQEAPTQPDPGSVTSPGEAAQPSPTAAEPPPGAELGATLQNCLAVLRTLDGLVNSSVVVPEIAREFHGAAGHLRNTAWAVQQWMELQQESKDTSGVLASVNSERVRFTGQLCRELVKEQQHMDAGVSQETRQALVDAVQALAEQLGVAVRERPVDGGRGAEAVQLDPIVVLAGLNQEIRSAALSSEETLSLIAERARSFTGADGAAIALGDEAEMVCCASAGIAPLVGIRFSTAGGLAGEAISSRQPVVCCDAEQDGRVDAALCRSVHLRASAILPIANGQSVTGVLQVFASRPNAFDETSVSLLQHLAEFVASLEPGLRLEASSR